MSLSDVAFHSDYHSNTAGPGVKISYRWQNCSRLEGSHRWFLLTLHPLLGGFLKPRRLFPLPNSLHRNELAKPYCHPPCGERLRRLGFNSLNRRRFRNELIVVTKLSMSNRIFTPFSTFIIGSATQLK